MTKEKFQLNGDAQDAVKAAVNNMLTAAAHANALGANASVTYTLPQPKPELA